MWNGSVSLANLSGNGTVQNTKDWSRGAQTLTVAAGSFSGSITDLGITSGGAGTGDTRINLVKNTAGTLTLSGTNDYHGTTTVNEGTLNVSGSITNSAVTVNNTGTVLASGTTGTVGKGVTVNNGAILAAGGKSAIGALVLDGSGTAGTVLNMASGSIFDWDLSANGGTPDQVNFWNYNSGDLALNANTVNLNLSGTKTNGTYTVDLFKFYSDSGTSLMNSGITSGLTLGTLGSGISAASFNYNSNTIGLTYTVVPEPTSALAGLLITAGLLRRRRK